MLCEHTDHITDRQARRKGCGYSGRMEEWVKKYKSIRVKEQDFGIDARYWTLDTRQGGVSRFGTTLNPEPLPALRSPELTEQAE